MAADKKGRVMATKRFKTKRARVDPVMKVAATILPECQVITGHFELHDVVNHSDDDQRTMTRIRAAEPDRNSDKARQTIRRKPKIDELVVRKVIDQREAAACTWYRNAHSLRYDTTGITANYGGAGGRSGTNFDHMPKTRLQQEAFDNFDFARAGINRFILGMFERVVLYDRPLGKLAITFKLAANQLLERIEGRVQL